MCSSRGNWEKPIVRGLRFGKLSPVYVSKVEDAEPNSNGDWPDHTVMNIAKNMGWNNGVFFTSR
jgi:hypothetical protein